MRQRPPLRWRARALLGAQRAWRSVGDTLSLTISADSDVAFNTIVMDGGGGIDDIDLIISAGSSGDIVDNGVTIVGGAGNDTIDLSLSASTVSTNTVTVDGGAGNDTIDVTLGGENVGRNTLVIDGRAGDDVIDVQVFGGFGGGNSVVVEGGEGNDTITGSFVDDVLSGGLGDDVLEGGFGDDLLLGGPQIGFGVELSGDPDAPTITLTNLALFAQITALAITIGDTAFGFDLVGAASPGTDPGLDLAASLDTGDTADDLVQTDLIEWSFTGFDGGDSLSFTAEIDPDGASGEGVDGLWIGHGDLSVSLGHPGEFDHPDFVAASERVIAACRTNNKPVARLVDSVEEGLALCRAGFTFIGYSADAWILRDGLGRAIADMRRGLNR